MISTSRTRPIRLLSERLLITKIITGVGLAFLLIVGAWSAAHPEAEIAGVGAVPVAMASDAAAESGAGPALTAQASAEDAAAGMLIGVAVCLLGLFCCLILVGCTRIFSLRIGASVLMVVGHVRSPVVATGRSLVPPLTLAQLSLSRT